MAKADETAPVKKGGMRNWLILGVVALIATLGGAALPYGLAVAGVGLPGLGGAEEVKTGQQAGVRARSATWWSTSPKNGLRAISA